MIIIYNNFVLVKQFCFPKALFYIQSINIDYMLTKMLPIIAILFLPLFLSLSSATIIVGIDENYPPHEFVEDGSVRGFNVDIIEAIAEEINETVEFKPMKWHDAVEALKNESIDALFMAKHKERLQYFDFSQPILDLKLAIFVKNNVYGIATIYDLAGHTVAVEKGDISFVILKQEVPDAIIIAVENQSMAIDLVEDGDAKAFFGNYYTGLYLIGKKGYKDLKIIGEEINIGKRCIAVKKGNIALLKKINEGIKKIKESGEYDAIYKKWFGQQIYKEYFPKWIFYLLLGLVLSIGGGAGALSLWNYTLKKKLDESTKEIVSYKNYLESILENAPIAILKVDGDFKVVYENPAMKKMMGADERGVIGRDLRNLASIKEFIKNYGMEDIFDRLLKGEMVTGEGWFTSIFGKTSYIYFKVVPLINGGFKGAILIADDWTERKQMEELYRSLAENANDAIYITGEKGFEYANPAFEKLFGYKKEELLDASFDFWKLVHPDDREFIKKKEEGRKEGKEIERYEFKGIRKDGKIIFVEANTVKLPGKGLRVLGILRDVTERVKAEEEIRNLMEFYRNLGLAVNRSRSLNEVIKEILKCVKSVIDYEKACICIKEGNAFKIYPDLADLSTALIDEAKKVIKGKKTHFVKNISRHKLFSKYKDKFAKYGIKNVISIPLMDKERIIGVLQVMSKHEINERGIKIIENATEEITAGISKIKAEEEVRRSEEKYRALVRNAVEGIYRVTLDGKILEVNPAIQKMFGYSAKEFYRINVEKLYKNPEDRNKFIEELKKKGEVLDFKIEYIRKDGKLLVAEESARLTKEGIIEGIIHDVTEEEEYERKLKAIAEVSKALVGKMDLDEIFEKSLIEVIKALGADGGVIFEMEDNQLVLRKAYGMSKEYIKKYQKLQLGEHLVGKVAMSGKSILIKNSLKDKRCTKEVIESEKYLSAVVVPIRYEGKVIGSMALISKKANYFSLQDLNILQSVANHIASAIKAAKWHQRVIKALEQEREFKLKTAHYFFNPICIAKGFLELAKEEENGKNKIEKAIKAIERIEKVVKNITQKGEIKE